MDAVVGDLVAGVVLLAIAVYSTAGGTDYGAGIWDLLAGSFRRASPVRALIDHAMAPVWEANNVWLVFAAVLTWTGFPILFQSAFASLYPLFAFALLGLVLRGAFFAFRKVATTAGAHRIATLVFGAASILAPFCFAASLGALASGRVGVGRPIVPLWEACLNPTSIMFGIMALAATAFSGAAFLVGDARRYVPHASPPPEADGEASSATGPDLVEYFRRRAIAASLATLVVGAVALAVLRLESPAVFQGMTSGLGLPFAALAVLATLGVAFLLWRRLYRWYRVLTVLAVGSFAFAWGFGQSPYLLPGRLTIQQAAGDPAVETALLVISVVALVLVVPSLALLYTLDQRSDLQSQPEKPAPASGR
jgi:cytochrome d ubiquinol oxidase subunit II